MNIDWPSPEINSVVTWVLFFDGTPAAKEAELTSGCTFSTTRPRWSTEGVTLRMMPDSRNWIDSVVTWLMVVVTL